MGRSLVDRGALGDAILDRFSNLKVPASLRADLGAFKAQHGAFAKTAGAAVTAEGVYEKAAAAVATGDRARDATVFSIADKLPGAGLSKRAAPFAPFSKYGPAALAGLPYAAETVEVTKLVNAIRAKKPPADVAKLCGALVTQNAAVSAALKALSKPLAAAVEARAARDAILPDWEKALRRLADASKVAFRDDPGRYAALFAPPERVQTQVKPVRRRPKPGPTTPPDGALVIAATTAKAKPKRRRH